MNGLRLTLTNDEAYELVIDVVRRELDDAESIAGVLEAATEPRR